MTNWIRRAELRTSVRYAHTWSEPAVTGAGRFVECDEAGTPAFPDRYAEFRALEASGALVYEGIERTERSYREPAVLRCEDCGADVVVDAFTNTCERCSADYNMSGQRLAPREDWGEETGESYADIVGPAARDR